MYREICVSDGCSSAAVRMVGPYSLCEECGQAEEASREQDRIRRKAIMEELMRTPVTIVNVITGETVGTFANEFEAELALEGRAS